MVLAVRNATVRDNIVFDHAFDAAAYAKAVRPRCGSGGRAVLDVGVRGRRSMLRRWSRILRPFPLAMRRRLVRRAGRGVPAFARAHGGGCTGERGITVSGGQRMRIALARAVYSAADVFLLDDPLAAVDAHVGQHIFDALLCGALGGATRVLVTNAVQYLVSPAVERILVLERGAVVAEGSYDALVALSTGSAAFRALVEARTGAAAGGTPVSAGPPPDAVPAAPRAPLPVRAAPSAPVGTPSPQPPGSDVVSDPSLQPSQASGGAARPPRLRHGKVIAEEARSRGSIARAVYWTWLGDMGPLPVVVYALACFVLAEGCGLALDLWCAHPLVREVGRPIVGFLRVCASLYDM